MSPIEKVLMHLRSAMGDATHKRRATHDEKDEKRSRKTKKHEPMDEDTKEELMVDLYAGISKKSKFPIQTSQLLV